MFNVTDRIDGNRRADAGHRESLARVANSDAVQKALKRAAGRDNIIAPQACRGPRQRFV
jgi:hypothetical protein